MIEDWRANPRSVAQRLIERGSVYDVEAMEQIYAPEQYILFVSEEGTVERADRAQTLAKFQRWMDESAKPLLTEADFLHAEAGEHDALILLRRRMRAHESSKLYELRLRKTASGWQVVGETVSPWPAADPADQGTER